MLIFEHINNSVYCRVLGFLIVIMYIMRDFTLFLSLGCFFGYFRGCRRDRVKIYVFETSAPISRLPRRPH